MQAQLKILLYLRKYTEGAADVYVMAGLMVMSSEFFLHVSVSGVNTEKTSLGYMDDRIL